MSRGLIRVSALLNEISMGPFGSDIKVENFVKSGVPVLNGSNVSGFKLSEDEFKFVTPEKAKTFRKAIARAGDVVITHRGTLGQIAYIPENSKYPEYVISQSQFKVSLNEELVDPRYFVYYFHTGEGQKRLLANKCHVGVPALAQATTNFKKIEIPLPNMEEQKKVVSLLSAIDEQIEVSKKIIHTLESMSKMIYDYWLVQYEFPSMKGKPYKSSGEKLVWNQEIKREIPLGWSVVCLLDIAEYLNGLACQKYRPKGEQKLKVIKIREMNEGFSDNTEYVDPSVPAKYIINDGDVLFSWSASLDVMMWTGGVGVLNQHIFKVSSEKYPKAYYYFELLNYLSHFKMMAENRKTTMGHITQDHLKQSRVVLPPKGILDQISEILNPKIEEIITLKKEIATLDEMRNWLLPMLMNKQISIRG
jgi:type I restriction enzyme S subunit